jgi:D-sedoheptulose 7-phosphate isomerase
MNRSPIPDSLATHFDEAAALLAVIRSDEQFMASVLAAGDAMAAALTAGGKVLSCGNGGSMCDAMHFAEELSGRYRDDRPALAALACSDPSHLTCVGNDYGFDRVFARWVEAIGQPGDVLVGISTSGGSANVIAAAEAARARGITVIGLTGKDGGSLAGHCDHEVRVPWSGYADRIQEIHIKVIHSWIDHIERTLFPAAPETR